MATFMPSKNVDDWSDQKQVDHTEISVNSSETTSANCQNHLPAFFYLGKMKEKETSSNKDILNSYILKNSKQQIYDCDLEKKYDQPNSKFKKLVKEKQELEKTNDQYLQLEQSKLEQPNQRKNDFQLNKTTNDQLKVAIRELKECRMEKEKQEIKFNELISLLRMQIKGNQDDWKCEHQEKIEIQKREAELKEHIHSLETKCREFQTRIQEMENCNCTCHKYVKENQTEPLIRNGYSNYNFVFGSSRLIPRKAQRTRLPTMEDNMMFPAASTAMKDVKSPKSPLSPKTKPKFSSSLSVASSVSKAEKKTKPMQCPECGKEFPQHVEVHFLEHFERCQRRHIDRQVT